jgi:hypothetical protein
MRVNLREIAEAASYDPKQALLAAAGDLNDYEVCHNLVLVATYIAADRLMKGFESIGGLLRPDRNMEEDRFQGKIGLVLKVGPLAFVDDGRNTFGGIKVKAGDWVMYRPSDGLELFIRDRRKNDEGLSTRLIEDVFIKMKVSDPSLIY